MNLGEKLNGQCLCGAVRFTAVPRKAEMGVCHCGMCRRWTGGVFMAVDCGDTVDVEDDSAMGVYRSSDWGERAFCRQCGSSLFWRGVQDGNAAVSMQAFAEPDSFVFADQIFVDEKPANYDFANQTRRMTGAEVMASYASQEVGNG